MFATMDIIRASKMYLNFDYRIVLFLILGLISLNAIFWAVFRYLTQKKQMTFGDSILPKNITLHRCPAIYSELERPDARPLTVMFAWLLAQDKHLSKYREFWFQRGFDVLIVRITPLESLLPTIGSKVLAKSVVKVLSQLNSEYNEIVVHSFSAGVYLFGEVLVDMFESTPEIHSTLINSIKGVAMDSMVLPVDMPRGLSITLTDNALLRSFIEKFVALFHKIFHNITVKHYNNSGMTFVKPPIPCPGLLFYSKDDEMSNYENVENLVEMRKEFGRTDIQIKCWDHSRHVLHYRDHQKEYEQELDAFIKTLNLKIFA